MLNYISFEDGVIRKQIMLQVAPQMSRSMIGGGGDITIFSPFWEERARE